MEVISVIPTNTAEVQQHQTLLSLSYKILYLKLPLGSVLLKPLYNHRLLASARLTMENQWLILL
jgi:hypothetical protein